MTTRVHRHQHYQMQHPKEMKPVEQPPLPDLTDFMNDWFFGAIDAERRRSFNLRGESGGGTDNMNCLGKSVLRERRPASGATTATPSTGRLTQEWLEEAKRIVGDSPSRRSSPARSTSGSPRFLTSASQASEASPLPSLDKRTPLSRSARRNRNVAGISDEILERSSARHNRNRSETNLVAAGNYSASPAGDESDTDPLSTARRLPPKLPHNRRSRFLEETTDIAPPARSFRTPSPSLRHPSLLPTENATDQQQPPPLSPPRKLLESAHRRSISSSSCSVDKVFGHRRSFSGCRKAGAEVEKEEDVKQINLFLRRQRSMVGRISEGEVSATARIVLSSCKPSTSSMVAAICYAWLLENTRERENDVPKDEVVVPVINIKRARMWEHKQAAWLFHHLGIDASALMFSDEIDLEGLLMGKQLSLLVVGHDVLQTNGEVGSLCTILADNYCEDAYNLLQTPILKRLLLAGILLDTQNLNGPAKFCTNRDSEAVQLLLVGSSPDYRDLFFEQVMQVHGKDSFLEAMREHYGKLSSEAKPKPSSNLVVARVTPASALALLKEPERIHRGKNKFSLGRLFGFGSK